MQVCATPGCPTPVESGHCSAHAKPARYGWSGRSDANVQRVRGGKLQRLRARLFSREPLCRLCLADGRYAVPVIRDHIVPLAEGGTEDDQNIQPLCQACSDRKTEEEAKRGRRDQGGDCKC